MHFSERLRIFAAVLAIVMIQLTILSTNQSMMAQESTTPLLQLEHHEVQHVYWSPDNTMLASISRDGNVYIWDATDGQRLLTFRHPSVTGASWHRDSHQLLTWGWDARSYIWNIADGEEIAVFQHDWRVASSSWSSDGTHILSTTHAGTVYLWSSDEPNPIFRLPIESGWNAEWSPDEQQFIAWMEWDDPTVFVFDSTSGEQITTLEHDALQQAAWSPDGSRILTWGWNLPGILVKVWNATDGSLLYQFESSGQPGTVGARWKSDNSQIVAWSAGEIIVWDVLMGEQLYRLNEAGDILYRTGYWNSTGNRILLAWDDRIIVWEPVTGDQGLVYEALSDTTIHRADWFVNEQEILVISNETAWLVSADTGEVVQQMRNSAMIINAAWTQDGCCLATWSTDGIIRVWDMETAFHSR